MSLTNAERQRLYRQNRKEKVSELESLRNENEQLKSELENLRNEIEELRNKSRSARNISKKLQSFEQPALQFLKTSVFDDDDLWDRPTGHQPIFDKTLSLLSVPLAFHQIRSEINPNEDFTRISNDIWFYSRGQTQSEKLYRAVLCGKGLNQRFEIFPPGCDTSFSVSYPNWPAMASAIELF